MSEYIYTQCVTNAAQKKLLSILIKAVENIKWKKTGVQTKYFQLFLFHIQYLKYYLFIFVYSDPEC